MGFAPQQIDKMSLWQFMACVDGHNQAQGATASVAPPTEDEYHDMVQRLSYANR